MGSLPLLLIITVIEVVGRMRRFACLQGLREPAGKIVLVSMIFVLAFLVKLPIFLVHS